MSSVIQIHVKLWDEMKALCAKQQKEIDEQKKELDAANAQIYADYEEKAAQRRTIATLRARKQRGHIGLHYRNHGPIKLQSFDPLAFGYSQCYQISEVKLLHEKRIAAIRNFGGLPGDAPSMPGYFYDGAWHAKPADGYKGRATFDAGLNDWTWWVVGFAGYVRAESYYEARARAEASLRNIGALS